MTVGEIRGVAQALAADGEFAVFRYGADREPQYCASLTGKLRDALSAYAELLEELKPVKKAILAAGDPWIYPRTRLWEDGTYSGDGKDLLACRDAVHDLYEIWSDEADRKGPNRPASEERTAET